MSTTATVTEVTDGDTIDVRLDDGTTETVRIIGIDTPETTDNVDAERRAEWEGIEELNYLGRWGEAASRFAKDELAGTTVDLLTDENEPNRGSYGRLLRYVRYDADGTGERDTVYNRKAVADGFARVYDSGFQHHDEYSELEAIARSEHRRVWTKSNVVAAPEVRDRRVEKLFVPTPASIETDAGPVSSDRVPVFAAETATQRPGDGTEYEKRIPLVAVDESASVALVGGPLIDETYEQAEGFPVDTSRYGNFPFLSNVVTSLTERSGAVLIDGGHGQFDAEYALSAEDTAYYGRYLEGQDLRLRQVNELARDGALNGRALIVTPPAEPFAAAEREAVAAFAESGGTVVLVGHSDEEMPNEARSRLNALAAELGTDLRLNDDRVTDETANLNGDPSLLTTTELNASLDLFDAHTPDSASEPPLSVIEVHPSPEDGSSSPTAESIVVENTTDRPLDLTGWRVTDEAEHEYRFPDGFTLPPGAAATLRTGTGTDEVVLNWNRSRSVWNDDGDTVSVFDDRGSLVTERSY
jgi:endonuclease YncB( thermonuclease family)